MKRFNDLKIGTKLLASFIFLAAIAGLIGWVGLSGVNEMQARSARMYADTLVPIRDLGYANAAFLTARTEVRSLLLTRDKTKRAEYIATIDAETKKTEAYVESYSKTVLVKEEQETLPKFLSAFEQYKRVRARVIELSLMGKGVEALALADGEARTVQAEARKYLRELIDINARIAHAHAEALLEKLQAAVGHGVATLDHPKALAKSGVALKMRETGDRIDREFERF